MIIWPHQFNSDGFLLQPGEKMKETKRENWSSFILRVFAYALIFGGGLRLSVYLGLIFSILSYKRYHIFT